MRRFVQVLVVALAITLLVPEVACENETEGKEKAAGDNSSKLIKLPEPPAGDGMTLKKALSNRRSARKFSSEPISLETLSSLCWAGQGITSPKGLRTAPSAGALYPIFLYVAVGEDGVKGVDAGIYLYRPHKNALERVAEGDRRRELAKAALGQMWMSDAPVMFIIAADYSRTTRKYGKRGIRYVHIEVGHVAQNILLEATTRELGACPVGAFRDAVVKDKAGLHDAHKPLLFIPVGHVE